MSSNLGSINIDVIGNNDPLSESLRDSTRDINRFADNASTQMSDTSDSISNSMEDAGDSVGEFSENGLGLFQAFAAGVSAAITTFVIDSLVEMAASFIDTAFQGKEFSDGINESMKLVQAQTGASAEEMAGLKESMTDVYTSGFAENMDEAAEAMSRVKRATKETGDELVNTTNSVLAFDKAFGADMSETIGASSAMMKGFGISGQESMDLMAYAMQKTGDPAGDLLGTFTEYSPLMKQIGIDAEQFTAGLIGGLEAGAFNTDVLADGFKELGISLLDPIEDVAPRMAEVLAAGGDAGAQAWVDIQDEIATASEDVDKHKEALDEATQEWSKVNDKVKEYQSELDTAWGKLQALLNPNLDTTKYTDQLRELEMQKASIELDILPNEAGVKEAKKALENTLDNLDAQIKAKQDQMSDLQKEMSKTQDKDEKERLQARIDGIKDEISAINDRKDAEKDSFDNNAVNKGLAERQDQLDKINAKMEEVNLQMKQEILTAEKATRERLKAGGVTEAQVKGMKTLDETLKEVDENMAKVATAQQKIDETMPTWDTLKQNMDVAQVSYDQAVEVLQNLQVTADGMPNPGEALGLAFKKGGADAQLAMSKFANSLLEAKKTMSDADFKGLLRDAGFGTLAEEMGADAFAGFLQGIANPGGVSEAAAGTMDEIKNTIQDRWGKLSGNLLKVFQPFWDQMSIATSRLLPIFERIVEYLGTRFAPLLENLGRSIDQAANKILPTLETKVMGFLKDTLAPWLDWLTVWVRDELPGWFDMLNNNAGIFTTIAAAIATIGGLLGGGGILGGALAALVPMALSLWAAIGPLFTMIAGGTLTASISALGTTLVATLGSVAAPLTVAGALIAAFGLAWATNFAGVRDITISVITGVVTFIVAQLSFLSAWWAKYGADVLVILNGLFAVVQAVVMAGIAFIMSAIEGFKLFWGVFGDDILNLITVAFSNIVLVIQANLSIMGEVIGIFADLAKGNWSGIWEHFVNIMTIQKDTILGILNNILSVFGTSIDGIVQFFADLPTRIASYFSPEALIKIATDAMTAFRDTVASMMPSLPDPTGIMGGLPSLSGAVNTASNAVTSAASGLTGRIPSPTTTQLNQTMNINQPGADINEIRRAVRADTISLLRQVT